MKYSLYGYWQSSSTWRVRIALNVKGVPFQYRPVDIIEKQQFTEGFTQKNLMHQVPVLETPTFKLTQSLAIFRYLEAKYQTPSMVPKDLELEGKMWEICEIINSGIQPLQNIRLLVQLKKLKVNHKEWAQSVIREGFAALQEVLEQTQGEFCIGNQITFADACLAPQVANARRYGLDLEPFQIITGLEKRILNVEVIQKTLPELQSDAPK